MEEQVAPIEYIPGKKENDNEKEHDSGTATFVIKVDAGNKIKRQIPSFRSGSDKKFLETMEAIQTVLTDYDFLVDADNIFETIRQVKECFMGPARSDFNLVTRASFSLGATTIFSA